MSYTLHTVRGVSILGLARSPTFIFHLLTLMLVVSILGLARSPTRRSTYGTARVHCFSTWAREEPNHSAFFGVDYPCPFQYLGSRGAQRRSTYGTARVHRFNTWAREEPNGKRFLSGRAGSRFNTWAREEPNTSPASGQSISHHVSILGLARSPTKPRVETKHIAPRFNTWAREEPNSPFFPYP